MSKRTASIGLVLASLLVTSLAAAVPPASAPFAGSPLHPASQWYGWQTLATDGAALALAWMTISATNGGEGGGEGVTVLAVATVGTYALGAPIVHFSHGNPGRGFGSLALRGVLPALGAEVGAHASGCGYPGHSCATVAALVGIAGAITLDAAVFSYEQLPVRSDTGPSFAVAADGQRTLLTAQGRF